MKSKRPLCQSSDCTVENYALLGTLMWFISCLLTESSDCSSSCFSFSSGSSWHEWSWNFGRIWMPVSVRKRSFYARKLCLEMRKTRTKYKYAKRKVTSHIWPFHEIFKLLLKSFWKDLDFLSPCRKMLLHFLYRKAAFVLLARTSTQWPVL